MELQEKMELENIRNRVDLYRYKRFNPKAYQDQINKDNKYMQHCHQEFTNMEKPRCFLCGHILYDKKEIDQELCYDCIGAHSG